MTIKQCDRCNTQYEPKKTDDMCKQMFSPLASSIMVFDGALQGKQLDLCDNCLKDFECFIDGKDLLP